VVIVTTAASCPAGVANARVPMTSPAPDKIGDRTTDRPVISKRPSIGAQVRGADARRPGHRAWHEGPGKASGC
jgi:hypothetical protein